MYTHNNVSHSFQDLHDSVQTSHHFVYRVIGRFPPSAHDRTLSNGTIGYSVFEVINGKSNALVHQIVQVQGVFAKSYHHANLQNKKRPRLIVQPSTKKKCYNDQHSRITCGQILGGSGDSWLFLGDENEPKLGSTIDSCQGFVAGL